MTSSSWGELDSSVASRIHLSLKYSNLTKESRKAIWRKSLCTIEESGGEDAKMTELEMRLDELAAHEMNGRQIQNALLTARHLSRHKGEKLNWSHLSQAIQKEAPVLEEYQEER